jgi:hypothetical protein
MEETERSETLEHHTYSPMKMEQTELTETLAFKLQTPVKNPEESIRKIQNESKS